MTSMTIQSIYELSLREAFLVFLAFSVIGWICEVIFCFIVNEHKFVNRGFLHGPLCPIYGVGGLVILCLPSQILNSWIPLFFCSMILCTIVEYFASWILEKMFHTLWWDYSDQKINLNGRVCLMCSILFGIMGIVVVRLIYPFILKFISLFEQNVIVHVSNIFALIFVVDLFVTVKKLVDFNTTLEKLKTVGELAKEHFKNEEWFKNGTLSEVFASLRTRIDGGKEKISETWINHLESLKSRRSSAESFVKRFPSLKSRQYTDSIAMLKQRIEEKKAEKKLKKQK